MAATKKVPKKNEDSLLNKTRDELLTELTTIQTELVEARRSHASRELSNTQRLKELRAQIARIKTALVSLKKKEEIV